MVGQRSDNTYGYSNQDFYAEGSAVDTGWVKTEFVNNSGRVFLSSAQMLVNDGDEAIEVSFDGRNTHGRVLPTPEVIEWYDHVRQCIWIRSTSGSQAYRLWAW